MGQGIRANPQSLISRIQLPGSRKRALRQAEESKASEYTPNGVRKVAQAKVDMQHYDPVGKRWMESTLEHAPTPDNPYHFQVKPGSTRPMIRNRF